ncbi:30S ribosomal protein S5 [bacterium HR35]|nr:30S ribosomal protein S5 [bacterium HR35]
MTIKDDFEHFVVDLARVAKVTEGGKTLRIRAAVVIGDRQGNVGFGIGKGYDTAEAVRKAINEAKKNLIKVPIVNGTVPFEIKAKFKSAAVLIKPARPGKGLIAGSVIRSILYLAGYTDVSAKIIGVTKNSLVNALAGIRALEKLAKTYENKLKLKEQLAVKKKNDSNTSN